MCWNTAVARVTMSRTPPTKSRGEQCWRSLNDGDHHPLTWGAFTAEGSGCAVAEGKYRKFCNRWRIRTVLLTHIVFWLCLGISLSRLTCKAGSRHDRDRLQPRCSRREHDQPGYADEQQMHTENTPWDETWPQLRGGSQAGSGEGLPPECLRDEEMKSQTFGDGGRGGP